MNEASKWEIIDGLEKPCADLSFDWQSGPNAQLVVHMHFSRVLGGMPDDVRLIFDQAMHMNWEDESLGLVALPDQLPYCRDADFSDWVYPTLLLNDSELAGKYARKAFDEDDPRSSQVRHFVLVSMNDIVHVISVGAPTMEILDENSR